MKGGSILVFLAIISLITNTSDFMRSEFVRIGDGKNYNTY